MGADFVGQTGVWAVLLLQNMTSLWCQSAFYFYSTRPVLFFRKENLFLLACVSNKNFLAVLATTANWQFCSAEIFWKCNASFKNVCFIDFDAITDPIMKAKMVALQGINKVMAQNNLGMPPMVMNRYAKMTPLWRGSIFCGLPMAIVVWIHVCRVPPYVGNTAYRASNLWWISFPVVLLLTCNCAKKERERKRWDGHFFSLRFEVTGCIRLETPKNWDVKWMRFCDEWKERHMDDENSGQEEN